jgi:YD repeat-containing protein
MARVSTVRLVAVCLAVAAVALGVYALAAPEGSSETSLASTAGSPSSPGLEAGLAVAGVQLFDDDQQLHAEQRALRSNPEVVAKREASRTVYSHLSSAKAISLDRRVFPARIDRAVGGAPQLAAGQKITRFEAANVAQVALPDGTHAVIESAQPIATKNSSHAWAPINLNLHTVGRAFAPYRSPVGVRIPRHLDEGVHAGRLGISITPVDAKGAALAGAEGSPSPASVLYANSQTDTDTVVKPTALGLDTDTVIRGVEAPQKYFYRLGLPPGARLREAKTGSGAIEAVEDGVAIAAIPRPYASDATGVPVPASVAVAGDTLVITVNHRSGDYQYPLMLDPEFVVVEETVQNYGLGEAHLFGEEAWKAEASAGATINHFACWASEKRSCVQIDLQDQNPYEGEYGALTYKTKGDTRIFEITGETTSASENGGGVANGDGNLEGYLEFDGKGGYESRSVPTGAPHQVSLCASQQGECTANGGSEGNLVRVALEVTNPQTVNYPHAPITTAYWGLKNVVVYIAQPKETHATVSYNTASAELEGTVNVLHGSGAWLGPHQGALEFSAHDGGLGVATTEASTSACAAGCSWSSPMVLRQYEEMEKIGAGACGGVQCPEEQHEILTYANLEKRGVLDGTERPERGLALPEGDTGFSVAADDFAEHTWSSEHGEGETTLKIYAKPPHDFTLTNINQKEELGERELHPRVEVTSGELGGSVAPGVRSIELFVDGKQIGSTATGCSPGPCTARAEWAVNGSEFAPGPHTLEIRATDNAGNTEDETYRIGSQYQASPIAVGAGAVNPETGAFSLEATDVDLSGGLGTLAVMRRYNSRNRTMGEEGALGPQWSLSLGSLASLEVLPEGSVTAVGPEGVTFFAAKPGGGFEAPEGDKSLTLDAKANEKKEITEYLLGDPTQGTTTRFTLPSGAKSWMPTVSEGPVKTNTTTDTYESVTEGTKVTVRPSEELAPHPDASCPAEWKTMQPGCRALQFIYGNDKGKVATGEAESAWGEYKGRLKEVLAIAYNPNPGIKSMERIPVAAYEYDAQGRLRAAWDPRVTPALKITYGYDAEGHVTAVSAPGEQPWLMHYGTTSADPSTGRLLSVSRFDAETPLWKGEELTSKTLPTLSNASPVEGTTLSVSEGTWNAAALVYGYQWMRCAQEGGDCVAIPGATNQTYTPIQADSGHRLVAQVTATNAFGSVAKQSSESGTVASDPAGSVTEEPVQAPPPRGTTAVTTIDYDAPVSGPGAPQEMASKAVAAWGQTDDPEEATAIFPPDEPQGWPASDYTRATIYYRDSHARTVNVATPAGGISTREYNETNNVVRALSPDDRAIALREGAGSSEKAAAIAALLDTKSTFNRQGTQLEETLGPQHVVKLEGGSEVKARNHVRYFYNEGAPNDGESFDLVTKVIDDAEYGGTESEQRETTTSYSGQSDLGWLLRKPTSVTTGPHGLDLVRTTIYNKTSGDVIETRSPVGSKEYPATDKQSWSTGSPNEQPRALVLNKKSIWVVDPAAKHVSQYSLAGKYQGQDGKDEGAPEARLEDPQGVAVDAKENIWVADTGHNRIAEFSKKHAYVKAFGEKGSAPGDLVEPRALVVSGNNLWVADSGNGRVEEFTEQGVLEAHFGTKGTEPGDLEEPTGIAVASDGNIWVADRANKRVDEFTAEGTVIKEIGATGSEPGEFEEPTGIAIRANGDVWVTDRTRVEEFSEGGEYLSEFSTVPEKAGTGGEREEQGEPEKEQPEAEPEGETESETEAEAEGKGEGESEAEREAKATSKREAEKESTTPEIIPGGIALDSDGDVWITNTASNHVEKWLPAAQPQMTGRKAAHDTRTVNYIAGEETEVPKACQDHPEWINLPCQSGPAVQPEVSGQPDLPVTTTTYNLWDEPEETTQEFGTTKRTTIQRYDNAGRKNSSEVKETTSEEGSPKDATTPAVRYEYEEKTGALSTQTSSAGRSETITSHYNSLGQLASYTDAAGNTTTYSYDIDGRVKSVNFGEVDEGKAYQTYTYSPTTGLLLSLVDSTAGTFTGTYDPEGKLATEGYPNGMTAEYTYNEDGQATGLTYVKTTHCVEEKEKCRWFKDTVTPSIHGETVSQTSTLASETAAYDEAGRLVNVQETLPEAACTLVKRHYTYEEEGERTSFATTPPKSNGKCGAKEVVATHSYDTADQLIDNGVEYEPLGDITRLPAADAAGAEGGKSTELTSTYYTDSAVASQTQDEETIRYNYDPEGRTLETEKAGAATAISHYPAAGEDVSWTSEASGGWTRDIPGIDGTLDAIQHRGEAAVIQIHNLEGDVVATAEDDSEKETKLLSTYRSTEFGVPTTTKPPPYSWLGAAGVTSEFPSGVIAEGGPSYVPQIAADLQTQGVQRPNNAETQYTSVTEPWVAETLAAGAARLLLQAQEARKAEEEANKPAGSTPAAGGVDPKCSIKVMIGSTISSTGKEWVYARGWAGCSGELLPKYSELWTCLQWAPTPIGGPEMTQCGGDSSVAGSGYNYYTGENAPPATQLSAHEHEPCEPGIAYWAWGWFWVPGNQGETALSSRPWECGDATDLTIEEFAWMFYENAGVWSG